MTSIGSQSSTLPFYLNRDVVLDSLTLLATTPMEQGPMIRNNNLSDITNKTAAQLNLELILEASPIELSIGGVGISVSYTSNVVLSGIASQTGTQVTSYSGIFTPDMVGKTLLFINHVGDARSTIASFIDSNNIIVSNTQISTLNPTIQNFVVTDPIYINGIDVPIVLDPLATGTLSLSQSISFGTIFLLITSYTNGGVGYGNLFSGPSIPTTNSPIVVGATFPTKSYPLATFSTNTTTVTRLTTRNTTSFQPNSDALTTLSTLTGVTNHMIYYTSPNTVSTIPTNTYGRDFLNTLDAPTARTNLGLVIGTNVQAYSPRLTNINNVAFTNGSILYTSDGGTTFTSTDLTDDMKTLLAATNYADARNILDLVIGFDVQAHSVALDSISGLVTASNTMIYTTAANTYATTPITAFGRSLIDDTTASDARTTLGAAPAVRGVNTIAIDSNGLWTNTDYFIDNSIGPITLTFSNPTSGEIGLYSIVWVQSSPGTQPVVIKLAGLGVSLNGQPSISAAGSLATFSTATTNWFAIRVQAIAVSQIAIDSSQPFVITTP